MATASKPRNAVAYLRVSTDEAIGGKHQTTENQRAAIEALAAQHNIVIVRWIEEQASGGAGSSRPQFESLMEYDLAKPNRGWDVLITWSLDRLTRAGSLAALQYLQRLREHGVDYMSATEPYLQTMGPFSEAIIAILAVLAKIEHQKIRDRTKAGIARYRKGNSKWGRRAAAIKLEDVQERHAAGYSGTEIALMLGVGRTTLYRFVTRALQDGHKMERDTNFPHDRKQQLDGELQAARRKAEQRKAERRKVAQLTT